ncbi:MAG: biopolymer transporter ExbD [Akkermansiaceae bacterium]|jgi:biopolymer transport protein ExbD|nr:biopolymer transporter ExbD [Akkermansiaceae bacterium]MDP4645758.1 biopolymer transporter ExbD [Akkermansiaceae bacterium]MDP4720599.1 biopolymer transporter ExbD [Akkermansiaceae bacterium]MDP4781515.1 biopolymer transporter ExbD [Akkermansiaceae bacterium]MDP4896614.1 biopolymer transporter ExbD [Akkermansiaceae bacterium]
MKRFRHTTSPETSVGIDISPLIDVVFLLLIFFIVTTVFVNETGIEISKPRAASSDDLDRQSILIAITSEGRVWQGGREIGMDGVRPVVAALIGETPDTPVIIRADASTPTQSTVSVIDSAKLAGATSVSLATEK